MQVIFGGVRARGGNLVFFAPFLLTIPIQLVLSLVHWYEQEGLFGMLLTTGKSMYWFLALPYYVWKAALYQDLDYADATLFTMLYVGLYIGIFFAIRSVRRMGVRNTLKCIASTLRTLYDPRTMGRHWHGRMGGMGSPQQGSTHAEKFDKVAEKIQKLPTEVFERSKVPKDGGTTDTCCSICHEDYEEEDVLRRLSCGHKFHLECVDRWAFSSTDYSRPTACPMCAKEL